MTDLSQAPPVIDTSVLGYLKPILTAAVTRGLLWLSAALLAHGIAAPTPTAATVAQIVAALLAFGMWAYGMVKAYLDHKVKGELQAAPAKT